MPIPPKGDPRRPLYLAIRSIRSLACFFFFIGAFASIAIAAMGPGRFRFVRIFHQPLFFFTVLPAAFYVLLAIYLHRRHFWAVLTSLILAALQLLLIILLMANLIIDAPMSIDATALVIPILFLGFCIVALIQLVYHLAGSFESIKYIPVDEQHGFDPILPALPAKDPP
jgi:hypothetical protein